MVIEQLISDEVVWVTLPLFSFGEVVFGLSALASMVDFSASVFTYFFLSLELFFELLLDFFAAVVSLLSFFETDLAVVEVFSPFLVVSFFAFSLSAFFFSAF